MREAEDELLDVIAANPTAHPSRAGARPGAGARSRTRSCGWARSSRTRSAPRSPRLTAHDAEAATAVIVNDERINEMQRERLDVDHPGDRDPVAGRPRPALPARARSRRLRARADGRPRGLGRQAGPQARARTRRSSATSTCRRWARSRPCSSATSCGRSSTSTSSAGAGGRGARRRDRRPVPQDLRRGRRPDAGRSRATSSAARGSCSRPTTSSGSATGSRTSPRTSSSWPPARSRT